MIVLFSETYCGEEVWLSFGSFVAENKIINKDLLII
jgi:hypothetical protein